MVAYVWLVSRVRIALPNVRPGSMASSAEGSVTVPKEVPVILNMELAIVLQASLELFVINVRETLILY